MTILPSGGTEQTQAPTECQLKNLARFAWMDVSALNCTRRQASRWLSMLWEKDMILRARYRSRVEAEMIRLGAKPLAW